MSHFHTCLRCHKSLTWLDLKNFAAKVGNFGLSFYGGYLCDPCLEKAQKDAPKEPEQ